MKYVKPASPLTSSALSILLFLALPAAYADDTEADETQTNDWTGNVSVYLGHKSVDDDDWPNLDSQRSAGVISYFRKESWPVSIRNSGRFGRLASAASLLKSSGLSNVRGEVKVAGRADACKAVQR